MDILRDAIERQKSVSFHYVNPKKPLNSTEACIGNPHAVYATAPGNINVDLYQTSGAILPDGAVFPAWRDYALKYMVDLIILEDLPPFTPAQDYKTGNRKYDRKFIKI
jgi:hypothetical protein